MLRYGYDELGQLVREDNRYTGKSYTWKYDEAGNILNRKTYAYTIDALGTVQNTVIYGYDNGSWGDLLISFNGQSIAYDGIGNPGTWNGSALTWRGRRLMSYGSNTYTYNADGIRTSKTVNGVKHIYHLAGTQILSEEWTEGSVQHILIYVYDASGQPIGMSHYENGATPQAYVFAKNIRGDITAVYDANGTCLVTYTYDAWGNVTVSYSNGGASTAARYNPFRYRGYYYDTETSLYYLNSRCYDPNVGRFLNADDSDYLGVNGDLVSLNLFAYSANNPVMRKDSEGNFWIASVGLGLATKYAGDVINNIISGKTGAEIFRPTSSIGEYIAAGVTALIPGTGLGRALVRNIVSEIILIVEKAINGDDIDVVESITRIGVSSAIDFGFEKISNWVVDFIKSKNPTTYSTYAHNVRKSNPNLTRDQIYSKMQRSTKINRFASKTAGWGIDIVRSILPY